ncbi:transcriptional regulator [Marinicella sp. W31]|uniref:winged helix-turn-helix domain-containing protein n=1 Tax=Marinicella sp. W31 TaxID=3023713 RepID=UPI003756C251
MSADNSQQFSIGEFNVDISRSQICHANEAIALEPKVLQVLLILARNQGQVVSHETLRQNVWPGVVVTPGALQRCIAQLRKVLGDDAKKQSVILTQPKVGYSLLVPVKWICPRQEKKLRPEISDI